jgi:hypothetical protein
MNSKRRRRSMALAMTQAAGCSEDSRIGGSALEASKADEDSTNNAVIILNNTS